MPDKADFYVLNPPIEADGSYPPAPLGYEWLRVLLSFVTVGDEPRTRLIVDTASGVRVIDAEELASDIEHELYRVECRDVDDPPSTDEDPSAGRY